MAKQLTHPTARAIGRGSAKSGVAHWWAQKLTAIANIPLTLWLIVSFVSLQGAELSEVRAWMGQPLVAMLLIGWVISVCYHVQLGLQVIVEDYVHHPALEVFGLITIRLATVAAALVSIVSVLLVLFGDVA